MQFKNIDANFDIIIGVSNLLKVIFGNNFYDTA